jgi:uncharacterized protein (DUF1697 family)
MGILAMADLRALIEDIGFGDVRTLLNSGNVVFSAPPRTTPKTAAAKIEGALEKKLGITARVTVLSAEELSAAVVENPLLEIMEDPSRLLVAVLMDTSHRARLEPFLEQDWSPDVFALGGRVAYLWCAEGILASRLAEAFGRQLGEAATSRNWATILKLQVLVGQP